MYAITRTNILREKLLNVNLLIANIEALKDNPVPSFDFVIKSPYTSLNLFLEETNTFDNSLPESETFCFDLEENSSGSTTTHADFSQYDSFIFDLSINPFPPADRSDLYHEEFTGELAHIISPPEYDHFFFKIEPELGNLTMYVVEDIFPTREPIIHVHNGLPNHPTLNLDFILSSESLFAYVVWIFLPFLTYPVAPPYLLSCGNEDTIFDPGISVYHSFMPGISHRSGTFMKFNDCPDSEASRARGFVLRSQELRILSFIWKRISHKRTKNKAKNDKTEHGMERCEKTKKIKAKLSIKPKSQQKSQTVKVNPDRVKVNSEKLKQKIQLKGPQLPNP
ncbi:hypothetical protein Tco_0650282 [Tanacetum coccineum]